MALGVVRSDSPGRMRRKFAQSEGLVAGPGHYVLDSAVLSPGGTWEVELIDRVSEFEQSSRTVKVSIR